MNCPNCGNIMEWVGSDEGMPSSKYAAMLHSYVSTQIATDFMKLLHTTRTSLDTPVEIYCCSKCFTSAYKPKSIRR